MGSVEWWDEECVFVLSSCFKTQWQAGQLRPSSSTTAPVTLDKNHHKRKKTKTFGLDVSAADQAGWLAALATQLFKGTNRQGGSRRPTLKQQGITIPNQGHPPCGCRCCAHNHLTLCVKGHEAYRINKTYYHAVVGVMPHDHLTLRIKGHEAYRINKTYHHAVVGVVPHDHLTLRVKAYEAGHINKPNRQARRLPQRGWPFYRAGVRAKRATLPGT